MPGYIGGAANRRARLIAGSRVPQRSNEREQPHDERPLMPPGAEHFVQPPNGMVDPRLLLPRGSRGSYALGPCCGSQAILATRRPPAGLIASSSRSSRARFWPRLGQPIRFWHMLVDTSDGALVNLASPCRSARGCCSLRLFSSSRSSERSRRGRLAAARRSRARSAAAGIVWGVIGTVLGSSSAATPASAAVSNQRSGATAGGLGGFSWPPALSGSAALPFLLRRAVGVRDSAPDTRSHRGRPRRRARFVILEAILIALFMRHSCLGDTVMRVLGCGSCCGSSSSSVGRAARRGWRRWRALAARAAPVLALIACSPARVAHSRSSPRIRRAPRPEHPPEDPPPSLQTG